MVTLLACHWKDQDCMQFISKNAQETFNVGKKFSETLHGGDIVLLSGELGAGKTTLVKGIAEGLGIQGDIVSPTFTLLNVYECRMQNAECKNFVHVDTYRLNNEQQLIDIGIEDYLGDPETVCVIEWPEKLQTLLKNITPPAGGGSRPYGGKKMVKITLHHADNGGRIIETP